MIYRTEFAIDGSVDPLSMGLTKLKAGDVETITLLVDGFASGDTITSIKLYAKLDIADSDTDVDTIVLTGVLTTPERDTNARRVTFTLPTAVTIRMLTGRVYAVRVVATRSAVTYTQTVMMGFIGAAYPGATAVAPSDEATLRAQGDAAVTSLLNEKVSSVTGVANRITVTGTSKAPIIDIAATYVGQTSITTVGTIGTGVWQGTQITDAYLAQLTTAGKVANSATTATAALTALAIVARDQYGDFIARDITARTFIPSDGGPLGYYPLKAGEAHVTDLRYHYDDILRWGADPTGATSSREAIKNASEDIGEGGILNFTPGGIWLLDGVVYPRWNNQTWNGNGSRLKRCDIIQTDIYTPITTSGNQTFTVADASDFEVGMSVGFAQSGAHHTDTLRLPSLTFHVITSIVGNVVTCNGGGATEAIASGAILYTSFEMVTANNTYDADYFTFRGFVLDGNATNNTLANRWEIHSTLLTSGDHTLLEDLTLIDAQADGILWVGNKPKMHNIRVYDSQGNGIHLGLTYDWQASNIHIINANLGGTSVGHADGGFIFSNLINRGTLTGLFVENAISTLGSLDYDGNNEAQFSMIYGKDCTYFLEMQVPAVRCDKVTITNWRADNCGEFNINESQNTGSFPANTGVHYLQISNGIATNTKVRLVRAAGVTFDACTFDFTGDTTSTIVDITQCWDVTFTDSCQFIGGRYAYVAAGVCQNLLLKGVLRNQYDGGAVTQSLTTGSVGVCFDGTHVSNDTTSNTTYIGLKIGSYGVRAHRVHMNLLKGALGMELLSTAIVDACVIRTPVACPSIRLYGGGSSVNNYVRGNWIVQAIQDLSVAGTNVVSENMLLDTTAALHIVANTVTATTFVGALTGNASTATLAATATALATARNINGVAFDGTANITVTVAGSALTGTSLAASIVTSSLTAVGILAAPHMTAAVVDSGGLTITSSDLSLTGAAATRRTINFQTATVTRWQVYADNATESGSDAGSNWTLRAYTDGGVAIDSPITVNRAAGGAMTLTRPVTNTAGSLSLTTAAGAFRTLAFQTAQVARWEIGADNVAEGGANAGSNFAVRAYTDAGALIDSPIAIARVAGGAITLSRPMLTVASATGAAGLRIPSGTAPSSPTSGDFWYDGTNLKFRDGGTTRTLTWT